MQPWAKQYVGLSHSQLSADHLKDMAITERKVKEEYNQPRDPLTDWLYSFSEMAGMGEVQSHTLEGFDFCGCTIKNPAATVSSSVYILLGTGRARSMQNIQEKMEKTQRLC